jgi:hypothetical protein
VATLYPWNSGRQSKPFTTRLIAARRVLQLFSDQAEFETFVRNYQNMVFSLSASILGNLADAEDITQEVFIKAYERFPDLRNNNTPPRAPECGAPLQL